MHPSSQDPTMSRTETDSEAVKKGAADRVCMHLGLHDDPGTYALTHEVDNYCYNRRPHRPVDIEHQARYCLAGGHDLCPFYKGWAAAAPLPSTELLSSAHVPTKPKRKRRWSKPSFKAPGTHLVWAAGVTVLLAAMACLAYFSFWTRMGAQAVGSVAPVSAQFLPPAGFRLALVHVAAAGDDWASIASRYSTSEGVLAVTNPLMPGETELVPGRLVVILPGVTDPKDLKPLYAYWITDSMTLGDTSLRYGVSEDHIRFWNQIEGDWVEGQRWLVICPDL
jgi:hypothetical protein